MATYTRKQREDALRKAGFPDSVIPVMLAISLAEWGDSRDVVTQSQSDYVNQRGERERSFGPFQINLAAHPDVTETCARDLQCSAQAAFRISEGGTNLNPWSTFTNGAYKVFLAEISGAGAAPPSAAPTQIATTPTVKRDTTGFPLFDFPKYDVVPPSSLSFPGGEAKFGGVKLDSGLVWKFAVSLGALLVILFGTIKLTAPVTSEIPILKKVV